MRYKEDQYGQMWLHSAVYSFNMNSLSFMQLFTVAKAFDISQKSACILRIRTAKDDYYYSVLRFGLCQD